MHVLEEKMVLVRSGFVHVLGKKLVLGARACYRAPSARALCITAYEFNLNLTYFLKSGRRRYLEDIIDNVVLPIAGQEDIAGIYEKSETVYIARTYSSIQHIYGFSERLFLLRNCQRHGLWPKIPRL